MQLGFFSHSMSMSSLKAAENASFLEEQETIRALHK